jgi:hydroxymethylglutaryl-CoA reductase
MKLLSGFSQLSKRHKLRWIVDNFFASPDEANQDFTSFWHPDEQVQKVLDEFSENTLTNYFMPFGVAPNFVINDKAYCVPMVIEESSVVAAAAAAAKFWSTRGGFRTEILGTTKVGQLHFNWAGNPQTLRRVFAELREQLILHTNHITANMRKRGGGISHIELIDDTHLEAGYYRLFAEFETCDSMGANFINSCLETFGNILTQFIESHPAFDHSERDVEVLMAILSNYTPKCLVQASVQCPVTQLGKFGEMDANTFAERFCQALRIAHFDVYRATTHNKGIFNGIDAVVLATGNDFRAVEACGHAYAARNGQYASLSKAHIDTSDNTFHFSLEVPIAIGTVGGLTALHPLAKRSLEMLGKPSAPELMQIIAATGLAQNFAAVRSLVTTGIQKGHMKMHLMNILNHLGATDQQSQQAVEHFNDKIVSFTAVRDYLQTLA